MQQKGVIAFDLDDTLYPESDYVQSGWRAISRAVAEASHGSMTAEEVYNAVDQCPTHIDAAVTLLNAIHDAPHTDIARLLTIYREHQFVPTGDYEPTKQLLSELSQDYTLALITDGSASRQRGKLKALGMDAYFDPACIIISEEVGADKYTEIPFRTLQERLGADRQYVYVADNPAKDFRIPRTLGWTTIMVSDPHIKYIHSQDLSAVPEEHRPDFTVESLNQIKTICRKL